MKSIFDLELKSLEEILLENGFKRYNATQIFEGIYKKRAKDFEEISNISKDLRKFLNENFTLDCLSIITKQVSHDGTTKYLLRLKDGYSIETVLMNQEYGKSLCVTTQVGCNMGCAFCASGLKKKVRSLEPSEMVEQILTVENDLSLKITHVVVMGTGEPFDNYDNLMTFIKIINHGMSLEIGSRHITVSTSGLIPRIYDYSKEGLQTNLAISLHAPNDEIRNKLMPINKKYPINDLMKAVKDYFKETGRRVTFEYILIDEVNSKKEHALELAKLIKGINAYVNLIPYNEVKEFGFKSISKTKSSEFYDILKKNGINVTLRKEHGRDIDAACGQLRLKNVD